MSKGKLTYTGPKILPGQSLHAYGREINPDIWDAQECEKWFAIEPRYRAYFSEVPKDETEGKK